MLGIEAEALDARPSSIRAILKAPVDLLWNGGIGTYVKATRRIATPTWATAPTTRSASTARELRCKVVGEGGNLGFTQLRAHRVRAGAAAASTPTRSTTPPASTAPTTRSTSRSCSARSCADGELTEKQRNKLLAEMTDDVAALVLRDNYFQTPGALGLRRVRAASLLDAQARFIRALERAGRLNRAIEFLPDDEEIAERRAAARASPRPSARCCSPTRKIALYDELLASDVPEDAVHRAPRSTATSRSRCAKRYAELHGAPPRCSARSSRRTSPTAWSTAWAATFVHRLHGGDRRASPPEVVRAYIARARRLRLRAAVARRSRRSTTRCPTRCSTRC